MEGSWVQHLGNPLLLEYELGAITILPRSAAAGDDTVLWVSFGGVVVGRGSGLSANNKLSI